MENIKMKKFLYFAFTFIFTMAFILCSAIGVMAEGNDTTQNQNDEQLVYYFLGSSVTYGHTTGGVSFVDNMAKDNGWKCVKRAVSGTTLVDNGSDSYVQRMKRQISTKSKMDHFICQLSTNDATQRKPLGTVSDSKNSDDFDTSTITGAMEYIIAYATETWNCPVTFYTNPYYNNKYYEKMIDALYELKEKWNIGIIDFYYYKDMEELPKATLKTYMSDDIHPNAKGYKWMAEVMSEYLIKSEQTVEPSPTPDSVTSPSPSSSNSGGNPKPASKNNTIIIIICIIVTAGVITAVLVYYMKSKNNSRG